LTIDYYAGAAGRLSIRSAEASTHRHTDASRASICNSKFSIFIFQFASTAEETRLCFETIQIINREMNLRGERDSEAYAKGAAGWKPTLRNENTPAAIAAGAFLGSP
jgi:hypothetical protein